MLAGEVIMVTLMFVGLITVVYWTVKFGRVLLKGARQRRQPTGRHAIRSGDSTIVLSGEITDEDYVQFGE